MTLQRRQDHWFSFKDCCVSALESVPLSKWPLLNHTLLFVHGRFGSSEMWEPLVHELSNQFRCITVDFPGYGRSFSAQGRAFSLLEHASLIHEIAHKLTETNEQVILIGHDFGGGVAQLCTLKSPDKIAALILINSSGITQALGQVNTRLNGVFARSRLKRMLKQCHAMSPNVRESLTHPWRTYSTRDAMVKSFRALSETWPWHYERQVWKESLQKLIQPVLLLWGKNDDLNPPDMASELIQRLPEAYFFVNEDCGHWPCLEQPQWVLAKMKEFIFRAKTQSELRRGQKFLSK
jgi:pimeloyl-ACP methyl ester carboxylesterase